MAQSPSQRAPAPAPRAPRQKLMSPWDMDDDFLDGIDVIAPGFVHVNGGLTEEMEHQDAERAAQADKRAARAKHESISGRMRRQHSPIRSPERSPIVSRTCSPLSPHISPCRARPRARQGEGSSRSPQRSPVRVPIRRTSSKERGGMIGKRHASGIQRRQSECEGQADRAMEMIRKMKLGLRNSMDSSRSVLKTVRDS